MVVLLAVGCGADPSDAPIAASVRTSSEPTETTETTETTQPTEPAQTADISETSTIVVVSTTEFVPETTEPKLPIPEGQLVAVPQQNREDPAKGQFQVQVVNGTRERFEVTSVQFVWAGYTTPVTPRDRSDRKYMPASPTSSMVTTRRRGELYSFQRRM